MLASRYELLEKIGNGAFGEVHRAKDLESGEIRAVKRLRLNDDGQLSAVPAAQFQEIEAMRQLQHPNIVKLLDVVPDGSYIALVLEYMPTDLLSVVRNRAERLHAADVRGLLRMLLHGVACCHEHSILHRDLKPGNLLLSADGVLKLSDFGLATVFVGQQGHSYSHQVATRWYRAPELLFGTRHYDAAVDMWAVGTVFAELLRPTPLFPGQNDLDQIFRVIQVLGDIERQWPGVRELPDFNKVSFPSYEPMPLRKLFPDAEVSAVDLLSKLLVLDPSKRLSARKALEHDFFFEGPVRSRFSFEATPGRKAQTEMDSQESDDVLASLGKPLRLA
ncbi:Cell cycle control protein 50A [Phytophthora pseudosyringae]|uniref:Cyclin-dependent kinase 2 homolog n=1 Tax=Phytophthora pseudosyringae TaxID=221518 RepID=A0A8T1VYW8_9STRA|nr:Cell cycle control protein 50A [Phytophthora pseudosyringae]